MNSLLAKVSTSDSIDPRLLRIVEEISQRLLSGQAVDVESLVRAYPDDELAIREVYPLLTGLVGIGKEYAAQADAPPALIGRYRLERKLGEGGMGAVYKALHAELNRAVAIKLLPGWRMQDAQAVARFQREMKAIGRLDHPNLVRATDAGEIDGRHFLVMDYVEGIDVLHVVRSVGPLAVGDACEIVRQAALGLIHIHDQGLVHRDLKPSNLMLANDGRVKILDLGLARLCDQLPSTHRHLTGTGQVMGTLDYMAPEQGDDSHEVDSRVDLYSLGATLYHLLAGKAPFSGAEFATPMKKISAITNGAATPLDQSRADLPPDLRAIVAKMMARLPEDRYATAAEIAAALSPFTAGADLTALLARAAQVDQQRSDAEAASAVARPVGRGGKTFSAAGSGAGLASTPAAGRAALDELPRSAPSKRRNWLAATILLAVVGGSLAAALYRVETPLGTLVIEVDDPKIETLLTERGVTVRDKAADRTYELRAARQSMPDGDYVVEVAEAPGGLEFETTQFKIRRGQTTVIQVTAESPPARAGAGTDARGHAVAAVTSDAGGAGAPTATDELAIFVGSGELTNPGLVEQFALDGTSLGKVELMSPASGLARRGDQLVVSMSSYIVDKGQMLVIEADGAVNRLPLDGRFSAPISLTIHDKSQSLIVCDNETNQVYRVAPGEKGQRVKPELLLTAPLTADHKHYPSMSAAATTDGKLAFSASDPKGLFQVPLEPDQKLPAPLLAGVDAGVAADPTSNRWVAMIGDTLRVYEGAKEQSQIDCPANAQFWHYKVLEFGPDGKLYVVMQTARGFEVQSVDLATGKFSPHALVNGGRIACLAVGRRMPWKANP